jgi:hypothetical protein
MTQNQELQVSPHAFLRTIVAMRLRTNLPRFLVPATIEVILILGKGGAGGGGGPRVRIWEYVFVSKKKYSKLLKYEVQCHK